MIPNNSKTSGREPRRTKPSTPPAMAGVGGSGSGGGDAEMGGWTGLLHSSTKLLEQAAPTPHFPTLQRNLDQLEALSTKLKAKTVRAEAPSQSLSATRLLAREGINAESLARVLKSFELKTTFEDVFPSEATTVEEYVQQLHEVAIVSSIQDAQKDNLRSFNNYMMQVLEDDWQKEKRDFLQSLSRLSTLPKRNTNHSTSGLARPAVMPPSSLSPHASTEVMPIPNKTIIENKSAVYAAVVRDLNDARGRSLPFNPATAFKAAYKSLSLDAIGTKSVTMQKMWHLIQAIVGEGLPPRKASRKMALVIGARRHLEWGHEKFILETINSHPALAALGGSVGNLQKIRAFLRVRLHDQGVLDFDATDLRRQPPIDTTWQQIYFCLRTGYFDEARQVAQSSRAAYNFAPLLAEWISTNGAVSPETALAASEECDKMLRMGDRPGRPGYDRKKLLLYAIICGCRRQIEKLLKDLPTLFNTIEDFLWFKLSALREYTTASSNVLNDGLVPYTLDDLQSYLNKFEPSYYTKNGKDPLIYPYVLFLSIQLLPGILYLSKEVGEDGYHVDAVHISIALADHGVLPDGVGSEQKMGVMDACAEAASLIRHYGSIYLRNGNIDLALAYYAQAAAAMGGGEVAWIGEGNSDQQRQRNLMLRQLLTEILLRDGGIQLLLGPSGMGEEGELKKYMMDWRSRQQFLLEAAHRCQEAGLYDKSVEIHKRVGAFAMALQTINKCLSDAVCAIARSMLDGESRAAALIQSGNEILETARYSSEASVQDKDLISEQQTVLRQLEAILHIYRLARVGQTVDALREIIRLPFLHLDPKTPNLIVDIFRNLSPHVQACVPDLLKVALNCIDNVRDTDGTLRAVKSKIANLVASNMSRNWPQDLYQKVAQYI